MIVVAYGAGTNSTALLIGMRERGIRPALTIFSDTGGEKPHTYEHLRRVSEWCVSVGFPEIVMVKRHTTVSRFERIGTYTTLEEDCRAKNMLPSIAYGFKGCSHKYKREPQDKFCNSHPGCQAEWAAGRKVVKYIGYDADETRRAKIESDEKYEYQYPLIEWGWGREECEAAIVRAGLPLPGKSSCFFCPSSKKPEIIDLKERYPDLLERALAMEAAAQLTSVKGLGRSFNWKEFLDGKQQSDLATPDIPCECYD